ncbi:hypothetical protein [Anaerobacillus alkalilacustris]|uniref:hypothetical protein n=1 Tax=Anaerobacillus alkalilacustris TaxID=393763 RepID=UPI003CCB757A
MSLDPRNRQQVKVGRGERNEQKLIDLYWLGYQDSKSLQKQLDKWVAEYLTFLTNL